MPNHLTLRHSNLFGAFSAAHDRRGKLQTVFSDEITAGITPAKVLSINTLNCCLNCTHTIIATHIDGCGRGLLLHRVHPAKPADALLIQIYGLTMRYRGVGRLAQNVKFLQQAGQGS